MNKETSSFEQDPISSLLIEFGVRLNELEEKQRLLKDRTLLIGDNLISSKEEYDKEFIEVRKRLTQIEEDIKAIKQLNKRMVNEIGNFARKTEFEILDRQIRMFDPLKFARISDIRNIVKEELSKTNKKNVNS